MAEGVVDVGGEGESGSNPTGGEEQGAAERLLVARKKQVGGKQHGKEKMEANPLVECRA